MTVISEEQETNLHTIKEEAQLLPYSSCTYFNAVVLPSSKNSIILVNLYIII